jgi:aspartyl-tRNA(Asn)/glutamyl-tRNA(Gln) amidotransferase subunit B
MFDLEKIKAELPELPSKKRERYMTEYEMTKKEADVCVHEPVISQYFEKVIADFKNDKKKVRLATNYILTDYLGILKKIDSENAQNDLAKSLNLVSPADFSKLVTMLAGNKINSRAGKDILGYMVAGEKDPEKIANEKNLIMVVDLGAIEKMVDDILAQNPSVIADYKNGKAAALQFLVGQGMKLSKGAVSPDSLKELLLKKIS